MMTDRHMIIEPGHVVRTAYVSVWACQFANRARMAVGDVDRAFQRILQLGDRSEWPCINGHWEGDVFMIHDGRHEYIASLMVGRTHVLVAWVEVQRAQGLERP